MKKYLFRILPVCEKYSSYSILKYYIIIFFLALANSISYNIIENTYKFHKNSCSYLFWPTLPHIYTTVYVSLLNEPLSFHMSHTFD